MSINQCDCFCHLTRTEHSRGTCCIFGSRGTPRREFFVVVAVIVVVIVAAIDGGGSAFRGDPGNESMHFQGDREHRGSNHFHRKHLSG